MEVDKDPCPNYLSGDIPKILGALLNLNRVAPWPPFLEGFATDFGGICTQGSLFSALCLSGTCFSQERVFPVTWQGFRRWNQQLNHLYWCRNTWYTKAGEEEEEKEIKPVTPHISCPKCFPTVFAHCDVSQSRCLWILWDRYVGGPCGEPFNGYVMGASVTLELLWKC